MIAGEVSMRQMIAFTVREAGQTVWILKRFNPKSFVRFRPGRLSFP